MFTIDFDCAYFLKDYPSSFLINTDHFIIKILIRLSNYDHFACPKAKPTSYTSLYTACINIGVVASIIDKNASKFSEP